MPQDSTTNFPHTGFVILRLKPEFDHPQEDSLFEIGKVHNWSDFLNLLPPKPKGYGKEKITSPYITAMSVEEVKAAEQLAKKSMFPPLRSLTTYWRIDYREENEMEKGHVRGIAESFNKLDQIEVAYPELYAGDPTLVLPCNDPIYKDLLYLGEPLEGMNISSVWKSTGFSGQGVGFIDLEQGWDTSHEDLPSTELTIPDSNAHNKIVNGNNYEGHHGTQVVGIVAAKDNDKGGIGIVPNVEYVKLASHYDPDSGKNGFVANAIVSVIKKLIKGEVKVGDVLLIEVQRLVRGYKGGLPTEILPADFDAIRLASALGIIVVEAGGNLNEDLDSKQHPIWSSYSDHIDINLKDSGAIMVAAAHLENNVYKKVGFSTYGQRINCFAPTDNIIAPVGPAYSNHPDIKVSSLATTSAASAIISGAAILVQSVYKNKKEGNLDKTPLTPLQMRHLISNFNYGIKPYVEYTKASKEEYTYQEPTDLGKHKIGTMPDLKKVVDKGFKEMPDLYIRRNSADTGTVPFEGEITNSLDLEVNHQHHYGYRWLSIHARVRNRSSVGVEFTADFYIKNGRTPLTFESWTKFNTSYTFSVAKDESTNLSTAYTIGNNYFGAVDCDIMVIIRQSECDNLIFPIHFEGSNHNNFRELLQSENAFEQFIRNNNNVACQKFMTIA